MRDSKPKYLGTKLYDGERAKSGSVIVRQRGTKILAGKNVGTGRDYTLFALVDGVVHYREKRKAHFNGKSVKKKVVDVLPEAAAQEA